MPKSPDEHTAAADATLQSLPPPAAPVCTDATLLALAPPGPPLSARELAASLDLAERAEAAGRDRPYLVLNMVSTADGRATLAGRSGEIGDEADQQLFHGLRNVVDAVMAGAGTMRTEGYRRLIRDEHARAARRARGLTDEPLACVVSAHPQLLGGQIPLLADPHSRVAILTASRASLPAAADGARIEYVRRGDDDRLDLAAALHELRARLHVRTLLCEGGPHLNAQLLAAGLVDELFLSLAPTLAGDDATGKSLRIVSGIDLDPPVAMELMSAHAHGSHLFLRYRI